MDCVAAWRMKNLILGFFSRITKPIAAIALSDGYYNKNTFRCFLPNTGSKPESPNPVKTL
jgi:hypothetical protein